MRHKGSLQNYRIGQADSDKPDGFNVTEQNVIDAVFNYCKPESVKCQLCPLKTRYCKRYKRNLFIDLVRRVKSLEKAFMWTPSATHPKCHVITFDDGEGIEEELISDELLILEDMNGKRNITQGYYIPDINKWESYSGRAVNAIAWTNYSNFINKINF